MFPGTVERLFTKGHEHAEKYEYDLAVEAFREALQYEVGDEHTLNVFAFALYETRQFEEAKQVTEHLLASGPARYLEIMELYLSICMELRDFVHVNQLIRSLLDENIVPEDAVGKFTSILSLSEKLAKLSVEDESDDILPDVEEFEVDTFSQLPVYLQMNQLQNLSSKNIRPFVESIRTIVETNDLHPIVRSVALYVLVEQQVDLQLTIEKFGKVMTINAKDLLLPDEMPVAQKVLSMIPDIFEKEGNVLEMVQYLVTRHLLVTYPFQWFDYSADEIVEGYNDYVQGLFGQVKETDYELIDLIQELEKFSDVPEV